MTQGKVGEAAVPYAALEAENAELRASLEARRAVVREAAEYVWMLDAGYDVLASDVLDLLKAAVLALDKRRRLAMAKPRKAFEVRVEPTAENIAALEEEVVKLRLVLDRSDRYIASLEGGGAKLWAKLEQAYAEAAVMLEALEMADRCEGDYCSQCDRESRRDHDVDCKLRIALSTDLAVQARHLLDVVGRARKLEEVLTHEELRGHASTQAVYDAHFNLIGALAVYDDKGKKKQTDG